MDEDRSLPSHDGHSLGSSSSPSTLAACTVLAHPYYMARQQPTKTRNMRSIQDAQQTQRKHTLNPKYCPGLHHVLDDSTVTLSSNLSRGSRLRVANALRCSSVLDQNCLCCVSHVRGDNLWNMNLSTTSSMHTRLAQESSQPFSFSSSSN